MSGPLILAAPGEKPLFEPGEGIRIGTRSPIGRDRVPINLCRKEVKARWLEPKPTEHQRDERR